MSKSETTNVDTKIKACLATLEAEFKQLKYVGKAEFEIREYLAKNPVTTIKAEDNNKQKTVTVNETVAKKVEKTSEECR